MFSGVEVATFSMVERGRTGTTLLLSNTLSRFLVTLGIGLVGVFGSAAWRFVGFGDTAGLVMLVRFDGASELEFATAEASPAGFSPVDDLSWKFMLRFHLDR